MVYSCFGQWSQCDLDLTCPYKKACYHAEEEYMDHITDLIEGDKEEMKEVCLICQECEGTEEQQKRCVEEWD